MIVPGILSSQKEPIKTTLLMAMNFGTNPSNITGIGTHVDMSGRGHTFTQHGITFADGILVGDTIDTQITSAYYGNRPDYDGRTLPVYDVRKLWHKPPHNENSGPTIIQIMDHYEDSGIKENPEYENASATYFASFPRPPRDFDYAAYSALASTYRMTITNSFGDDVDINYDAVDYWSTAPYRTENLYLYDELQIYSNGNTYLASEVHTDFDWGDDVNFRISFEITPLYDAGVTTLSGSSIEIHPNSSGLILSNGSFDNQFRVSYISSGDTNSDPAPITPAQLRIEFGENTLTITEADIYPLSSNRYLRNGYQTNVRIDRINGIAYIYIQDVFIAQMTATGVASTFDVRVEQVETSPGTYDYQTYINDVNVTGLYIGTPTVASYGVKYPIPCNKLVLYGQEKGFGGNIQNLHLFSIDN